MGKELLVVVLIFPGGGGGGQKGQLPLPFFLETLRKA